MPTDKENPIIVQQDEITSDKARAVFDTKAQTKLDKAHDTLVHPDQFANVFCQAADTQVKVREILVKEIKQTIKCDAEARKSLKEVIKELEKEEFWIFGKKVGFAVWTIAVLLVGALISAWVANN